MLSTHPIGPGDVPPVTAPQNGAYPQDCLATQPGQVIIIQSPGIIGPRIYENYARLTSMILGIGRIGIGIMSIVFTIVTIVVDVKHSRYGPRSTSVSGAGIWCGIIFILAGVFGVAASKQKTMGLIMTNMVLSIVSVSVFVVIYVILSALGFVLTYDMYRNDVHYYGNSNIQSYGIELASLPPCDGFADCTPVDIVLKVKMENKGQSLMVLFVVMIILAVAECVCDIWSSVICCKAVCCGYSATAPTHQVQYMAAQPGQQQIFQNNPSMGYQPVPSSCNTAPGGFQMPVQGMPLMGAASSGGDSPPPAYVADAGDQKKAPVNFVN